MPAARIKSPPKAKLKTAATGIKAMLFSSPTETQKTIGKCHNNNNQVFPFNPIFFIRVPIAFSIALDFSINPNIIPPASTIKIISDADLNQVV